MSVGLLRGTDRDLLLSLLSTPTAGPLEIGGDGPCRLWDAQCDYAAAAADIGFAVVHHAPAAASAVQRDDVPSAVLQAARSMPGFLDCQPSLVLRLGPALGREAMVMFNVHLDTVAGEEPVSFDGERFHGRGAIDAKGPAVALLAGIRSAVAVEPRIGTTVGVLIQAVAGEEGGGMGSFGTRPLVEQGYVGRLNVFCEPTRLRYLLRCTAAMTACVRVDGIDAIDDQPGDGHNATVLLGFLAQYLAGTLPGRVPDGQVCLAGLHTGPLHNRVYGTGTLLLNLSYGSPESARQLESSLERAVRDGLAEFQRRFRGSHSFAKTAADAAEITRLEWLKRNLPVLTENQSGSWAHAVLGEDAGLARWPDDEPAFTCDAIWMSEVSDACTAVVGPGDLAANNAHAAGEYADLADLERFADAVARVLIGFAR